jgi:phosphoribosylaminoimidazole carboxylase (NCAIR synthetase)
MRTDAVAVRTTLVVLRYRFDIRVGTGEQLLAEEAEILAFTGTDSQVEVLSVSDTQRLLTASPTANVSDAQAQEIFSEVIESIDVWTSELEKSARSAGERLLESHDRVRSAVRLRTSGDRVDVQLPVDVLGVFVLIPGKKVS